jgi:hypothetical protein
MVVPHLKINRVQPPLNNLKVMDLLTLPAHQCLLPPTTDPIEVWVTFFKRSNVGVMRSLLSKIERRSKKLVTQKRKTRPLAKSSTFIKAIRMRACKPLELLVRRNDNDLKISTLSMRRRKLRKLETWRTRKRRNLPRSKEGNRTLRSRPRLRPIDRPWRRL